MNITISKIPRNNNPSVIRYSKKIKKEIIKMKKYPKRVLTKSKIINGSPIIAAITSAPNFMSILLKRNERPIPTNDNSTNVMLCLGDSIFNFNSLKKHDINKEKYENCQHNNIRQCFQR